MVKKWAGFTARRWRQQLEWVITTHQFTLGSKTAQCFSWRSSLINNGDWETLPIDIKYNIQLYAYLYEKTYPRMIEEEKKALEEKIERLEIEKQSSITLLNILNKSDKKILTAEVASG